jgi:hypothetical protein
VGKYISLAALCLILTPAHAGEIGDLQAESIDVGGFHGVVYYTRGHDGYRVVATIAEGETGVPVRFEAVLTDTQKLCSWEARRTELPLKCRVPAASSSLLELSRTLTS